MSDQLKVILLASAAAFGFVLMIGLVLTMGAGAFLMLQDPSPAMDGGVEINVSPPGSDANWTPPNLGKDPDAYRIPFRRNDGCNGPNCPS